MPIVDFGAPTGTVEFRKSTLGAPVVADSDFGFDSSFFGATLKMENRKMNHSGRTYIRSDITNSKKMLVKQEKNQSRNSSAIKILTLVSTESLELKKLLFCEKPFRSFSQSAKKSSSCGFLLLLSSCS